MTIAKHIYYIFLTTLNLPLVFFNFNKFINKTPVHLRIVPFMIKKIKNNFNKKFFDLQNITNQSLLIKDLNKNGYIKTKLDSLDKDKILINFFKNDIFFNYTENNLINLYNKNKEQNPDIPFLSIDIKKKIFESSLERFLLSSDIFDLIANYLNCLPILYRFNLMYTPKNQIYKIESSQFFHTDCESYKSIKIFINLEDISIDNGPFTFLNKEDSQKVFLETGYSKLRSKRMNDEKIINIIEKNKWKRNIGSKLDCLIIDADSCLHFGSRDNRKSRFLCQLHYVHPSSFVFDQQFSKFLKKIKPDKKEVLFSYINFLNS
jgi:hypothetical protein